MINGHSFVIRIVYTRCMLDMLLNIHHWLVAYRIANDDEAIG